jgi:Zn-dependent protease
MRFSDAELKELLISAVVIGFSFAWILRNNPPFLTLNFLEVFLMMMIAVGASFILHELAHKAAAQRYGCWAEYRMWETGLILAFFLAVSPLRIVFAAPGAVYISGGFYGISIRQNGIISVAGPVTNLILAGGFLMLAPAQGFVGILGNIGFFINAWLAFFNMIPFPPLDGSKVITWSFPAWLLVCLVAFFFMTAI